jgi:hypothetical protein
MRRSGELCAERQLQRDADDDRGRPVVDPLVIRTVIV